MPALAQAESAPPGPLFHPDGPGRYRLRASLGALIDIIPRNVAESEIRQLPRLAFNLRLGLPAGFSADLRLSAIYVTNQASLGLVWSRRVGDFSFAVLDHVGMWFGFLGVEGFDSLGYGILQQPGLSLGYAFGEHRVTLTSEAIITLLQYTAIGDASRMSRKQVDFAGLSNMLTVESFFRSGGALYYGAGLMWTQPDYQAWIAFSDSRLRYLYPRFVLGYVF